ncbi:MAG: phosphoribosylanthranilate isomerase [Pseudomonadota bacterium]
MPVQIKICGLSTPETIAAAASAGATHIGLVHFEKSPRHVSLERAAELRALVPRPVKTVLLLVNADPETTGQAIQQIRPDVIQFHGKEAPEWIELIRARTKLEVWKALGVKDAATLAKSARFEGKVDRLLFDAPASEANNALPGGTGKTFQWELLQQHSHKLAWGLAGGLSPANVARAIAATGAELVDTSSGVESAPGIKDVDKIRAFCQAALDA